MPYQTTTSKQDGNTSIILQAITAMPQYEQKSFEELRLEDYMAGNKGTKGQAAPATSTGFGGFGVAPGNSNSLHKNFVIALQFADVFVFIR